MHRFILILLAVGLRSALHAQGIVGSVTYQTTTGVGKEVAILNCVGQPISGDGYWAELWFSPDANASESALQPIPGSLVPFRATGGVIAGKSRLDVPGTLGGDRVTLQIRVWENRGQTVNSWADLLKPENVNLARGYSKPIQNWELGGVDAANGPHIGSGNVAAGFEGFKLYCIPEPSTAALITLAFGSYSFRQRYSCFRRKNTNQ